MSESHSMPPEFGDPSERMSRLEGRIATVEDSLVKAEVRRIESMRPPTSDDVQAALRYARELKGEHEEGKLTDPERMAVVLAKELERVARLWNKVYRECGPGSQAASDDLVICMRRVLDPMMTMLRVMLFVIATVLCCGLALLRA